MVPAGYYEDIVRRHVASRPWVVAFDSAVPAARYASQAHGLGLDPLEAAPELRR